MVRFDMSFSSDKAIYFKTKGGYRNNVNRTKSKVLKCVYKVEYPDTNIANKKSVEDCLPQSKYKAMKQILLVFINYVS